MKIEEFARITNLTHASELDKVAHLAYYFAENKDQQEFEIAQMCSILVALGYAAPNSTRLKRNIQKSKDFVKGSSKNTYRLSVKAKEVFKENFPEISESEEILSDDSLLPEILFQETRRPYLIRIAQQVNSSYENNLFDACTLMMRRLLEILIIHSFQHHGIEKEIQDADGNYQNLKLLISKAKSRAKISLSPSVRRSIDDFRELGNLSAHRIAYNCRRDDIRPLRLEYRAVIEELLYKAGLKK
ncbi:MAG: DUF4145 domain-containing protein [Gallionella sp.]|nr:DUF4145 domain-containing protein [Gallionella sp.]